jgi:mannose-6-phosphate isomerase-like protein (cupin superfamily)
MKTVEKTWGGEQWFINNELYCMKALFLDEGGQCSLHCHHEKDETFQVVEGLVLLETGTYQKIENTQFLQPGSEPVRIKPDVFHRFTGCRESTILEISTHHSDKDVERKTKSRMLKINYVDIDGFLFTDHKGIYRKAKPIQENIDMINKKAEDELIILWTSRGSKTGIDWTKLTVKQLAKAKVKFHDLRFDKPYYDEIWDDKAKCMKT